MLLYSLLLFLLGYLVARDLLEKKEKRENGESSKEQVIINEIVGHVGHAGHASRPKTHRHRYHMEDHRHPHRYSYFYLPYGSYGYHVPYKQRFTHDVYNNDTYMY